MKKNIIVWKSLENFPKKNINSEWTLYQGGLEKKSNLDEIKSIIKERYVFGSDMLIGSYSNKLLPPIFISELENNIFRFAKSNALKLAIPFSIMSILMLPFLLLSSVSLIRSLEVVGPFIFMSIIIFQDYFINLRTKISLTERSLFIRFIRQSHRTREVVYFWVICYVLIGGLQLSLFISYGSLDALFQEFGLMFQSVDKGEYWRLITGPFLHYSLSHYLINGGHLIIISIIGNVIKTKIMLMVFIVGCIGSLLYQYLLGGHVYDNAGGISGGTYALSGLLFALGLHPIRMFAKGIPVYVVLLSFSGIFMSMVWSSNSANAAHISGLIIGIIFGLIFCSLGSWPISERCLTYGDDAFQVEDCFCKHEI